MNTSLFLIVRNTVEDIPPGMLYGVRNHSFRYSIMVTAMLVHIHHRNIKKTQEYGND